MLTTTIIILVIMVIKDGGIERGSFKTYSIHHAFTHLFIQISSLIVILSVPTILGRYNGSGHNTRPC